MNLLARLIAPLFWLLSAHASAQTGLRALDAVWLTPRLGPEESALRLALHAGYGALGAVAGTGGAHHRAAGGIGLGLSLRQGFGFELRLDGRWDVHDVPGGDDSLVGEPRLFARYAHGVGRRARLGLEVGAWFPGATAPSLRLSATSVDALALAQVALPGRLTLITALGARVDESARSLDTRTRLSRSDQISLGLSDYHALLARFALEGQLGKYRLAGELSADTLLGAGAPRFIDSPLRAALVLRHALTAQLEGFALVTSLLSGRPPFREQRHVPFEPRVLALIGVRYAFEVFKPAAARVSAAPPAGATLAAPPPVALPEPSAPQLGGVVVRVLNEAGEPLPDAQVTSDRGDVARSGGSGNARLSGLAQGALKLTVVAPGFASQTFESEVVADRNVELSVRLRTQLQQSLLRVFVRDAASGSPLSVELALTPLGGRKGPKLAPLRTGGDGSAESALAPGRYRVLVRAEGYTMQTRELVIEERGVTLFNVDLTRRQP